jgi:flavin-dependent dehydrogenase
MSWDAAIVGGGLAGAAVACHLADAGRRVLLLERGPGPHHKVCGEFWSVEAQVQLDALAGVPRLLPSLGAAPIECVHVVCGLRGASAPLPFLAWGLSRRRLDAWLLEQAGRRGVDVRRGRSAQALDADGAGVRLRSDDGSITADLAVLATGKHELRGRQRPAHALDLIGFKQHFRLADAQRRALVGQVELVLFAGGYAGLQLVEDGLANLCLVVSRSRYAGLGRNWRHLLASVPHLAQRLSGAEACWPKPLAIYRIPYGYLHAADGGARIYRVGDQAAVIPSFTGDGMAMALHSARLAAEAIRADRSPAAYHRDLGFAFRRPLRIAGIVAALGAAKWLQPVLTGVCRLAPSLMTGIAAQTRVRAPA